MAKLTLKKDSTNISIYIFILDSSSTTGAGLTGLSFNSVSLTCFYIRPLETSKQLILVTQTIIGEHTDGGFVEIDATNMPGIYRLDLSDIICAEFTDPSFANNSVDSVVIMLNGATNMAPTLLEIQLASIDLDESIEELLEGVPSITPSMKNAMMLLYMAFRNKTDVATSGTDVLEIHNNANEVIAKKILTDDGSDYSEAQMISGP